MSFSVIVRPAVRSGYILELQWDGHNLYVDTEAFYPNRTHYIVENDVRVTFDDSYISKHVRRERNIDKEATRMLAEARQRVDAVLASKKTIKTFTEK